MKNEEYQRLNFHFLKLRDLCAEITDYTQVLQLTINDVTRKGVEQLLEAAILKYEELNKIGAK